MKNLQGNFFSAFLDSLGGIQPGKGRRPALEAPEAVFDDSRGHFELPGQFLAAGHSGTKTGVESLQSAAVSEKAGWTPARQKGMELLLEFLLIGPVLLMNQRFLRAGVRVRQGVQKVHGLAVVGLAREPNPPDYA